MKIEPSGELESYGHWIDCYVCETCGYSSDFKQVCKDCKKPFIKGRQRYCKIVKDLDNKV